MIFLRSQKIDYLPQGSIFIKGDIVAYLHFPLTRHIDSIGLQSFTVAHKHCGLPLDASSPAKVLELVRLIINAIIGLSDNISCHCSQWTSSNLVECINSRPKRDSFLEALLPHAHVSISECHIETFVFYG